MGTGNNVNTENKNSPSRFLEENASESAQEQVVRKKANKHKKAKTQALLATATNMPTRYLAIQSAEEATKI